MSSFDEIEDSNAPLMEHLTELRQRLMWAFGCILVAFLILYTVSDTIFQILVWPYEWAKGEPINMIATAPHEQFFTYIKVALFGAIFCAFPIIATQIYMFVAPGLYKNEKKAFLPYLIATPILFLVGAMLVYFIVMPMAMQFFLSLEVTGDGNQIVLQTKVSEYLSFIMLLIMAFGFCFQLPVILTLLANAGFIDANWLRQKRKFAIVGVFLVAAFLTPPDPVTQIALAIPTLLLYEFSIWSVSLIDKKRENAKNEDDDDEDDDE